MAIRNALHAYPIVFFTIFACLFGWILFIISGLGGGLEEPSNLPIAPIIAAAIVAAGMGRDGWKAWTRQLGRFRASTGWYALAIAAPMVIVVAAVLANAAFGAPLPTPAQLSRWTQLPLVFVFFLLLVGVGEEAGWTAFAAPRLLDRQGFTASWAVLSGIRVFWHLPLMLSGDLPWVLGVGGNAAFQFLVLWIFVRSGRVWFLAAVWHAVLNTVGGEFFFGMAQGADNARLGVLLTAGYALLALVVLITDRRRLSEQTTLPAPVSAGGPR